MMKFAVLAFAAVASVTSAADCSLISLAQAAGGSNAVTCGSESGYQVTSAKVPTDAQLQIMCFSTACKGLLTDLKTAAPTECQLTLVSPSVPLYATLLDPIQAACDKLTAAATPTTAPPSTTAAPSTSAPGATTAAPTPTVTDATSC